MKELLSFLSAQTSASGTKEGLPFWIFWFLLSIIALLMIFIFLRDKDLRQRISGFLFGIKQKLIKFRLQRRLRRIKKRKNSTLIQMGRKGWDLHPEITGSQDIYGELEALEKEKMLAQKKLEVVDKDIAQIQQKLNQELEEIKKHIDEEEGALKPFIEESESLKQEQKSLESRISDEKKAFRKIEKEIRSSEKRQGIEDSRESSDNPAAEESVPANGPAVLEKKRTQTEINIQNFKKRKKEIIRDLESGNDKISSRRKIIDEIREEEKLKKHDFQKELKDKEKIRDKNLAKIEEINKQEIPLFESLGKRIDTERPDLSDMALFYQRIDRIRKRIHSLEERIGNLS